MAPTDLHVPDSKDGSRYEFSGGQLISLQPEGALHEFVKSRILKVLFAYECLHPGGAITCESMFTLSPARSRTIEVAFVGPEKYDQRPDDHSPIPFAPELAVDIISQTDRAAEPLNKAYDYKDAGVREVWQVYIGLPGFEVPVSTLFSRR